MVKLESEGLIRLSNFSYTKGLNHSLKEFKIANNQNQLF